MKKRSIMALVAGGLLTAMLPGAVVAQTFQADGTNSFAASAPEYAWDGRLASSVTREYVWDSRLASSTTSDYAWDGRLASSYTSDYAWDGRLASSYTSDLALTK